MVHVLGEEKRCNTKMTVAVVIATHHTRLRAIAWWYYVTTGVISTTTELTHNSDFIESCVSTKREIRSRNVIADSSRQHDDWNAELLVLASPFLQIDHAFEGLETSDHQETADLEFSQTVGDSLQTKLLRRRSEMECSRGPLEYQNQIRFRYYWKAV